MVTVLDCQMIWYLDHNLITGPFCLVFRPLDKLLEVHFNIGSEYQTKSLVFGQWTVQYQVNPRKPGAGTRESNGNYFIFQIFLLTSSIFCGTT